jgi:BirA family transcriptional regulator, biotin operon repressor / biotin---[acetyl-CoA-carboxylase] ligase
LILNSGHRVVHFERIDSTNVEARRLAEAGERGPLWILADEQTQGRGRLGRGWISKPGNLYGTFMFATKAGVAAVSQLGFVAALSVLDAVTDLFAGVTDNVQPLTLKWPNDVLINGAKFCGLLSEIVSQSPTTVALGCGINLAHAPEGMSYPVAALGADHTPGRVLPLLDNALVHWLGTWDEGRNFAAIRTAWERHGPDRGANIIVDGQEGALRLRLSDGAVKLFHAGDVRMGAMA